MSCYNYKIIYNYNIIIRNYFLLKKKFFSGPLWGCFRESLRKIFFFFALENCFLWGEYTK